MINGMIGILINGRFITIGSVSELKNKFGEYTIIIYQNYDGLSKRELDTLVKGVIPQAKMQANPTEKGVTYKVMSM